MSLFAAPKSLRKNPRASFWIGPRTKILCARKEDLKVGRLLAERIQQLTSAASEREERKLPVARGSRADDAIVLRRGAVGGAKEGFRITVTKKGVTAAAGAEGMRWAGQALGEYLDPAGFFPGGSIDDAPAHPFRAVLIHMTHYDPKWFKRKRWEKRIDYKVAERVIREAARCRLNALMIDVADGVVFRNHRELKRQYSITMAKFKEFVKLGRSLGMEIIPKLNFSKSFHRHHHNEWMRPYNKLKDDREYYRHAFSLMSELIRATKPKYFHIGMDEDHEHTPEEYVEKIVNLRGWLKKRGVKTIQWIDIGKRWQKDIEAKMRWAVGRIPKDVILCHWQYFGREFSEIGWLKRRGYPVLATTGGYTHPASRAMAARAAEQRIMGMISTHWAPLQKEREQFIIDSIRESGRAFWEGA